MASTATTSITCTDKALSAVDAELIVCPWFEGDAANAVPGLDAATGGEMARALASGEFTGKAFDWLLASITDGSWRARRALVFGAGLRSSAGADVLRRVAVAAGLWARERRVARSAFVLSAAGDDTIQRCAQAVTEGLTFAEFDGGTYKTTDRRESTTTTWLLATSQADSASLLAAVAKGRVLGESCNMARALANEPGNTLTPTEFANRIEKIGRDAGLAVDVLDERRIAELKMGLLLGVARGSSEPPRLVVLRHDPPGAPASPVLGLVGKGITFDTGGISIKPADGMERMKDDMAGGAAVACAMRALALLGAPTRVIAIVPATENMPGGRAVKPGDVLTSASGKTVEVINTDAEGRLILGDGLWYARQLGATHLVDVATLTGACVVALGKITSGLFGTPDAWVERVRETADRAGERVWPMPLFAEYREQLKSEIADLTNTGGRPAGAVTAAMFLKEFSGGLPWAHLDVAGTAWADDAKPYLPKGATGVAVRTLAELALSGTSWASIR